MDLKQGEKANPAQGKTVEKVIPQQQGKVYGVGVQAAKAGHDESAIDAWEAERIWMVTYLVISVLLTVAFALMFWPLVFSTILGMVAACLHCCSCCTTFYRRDGRRGAHAIRAFAITSTVVAAGISIFMVVLAFNVDPTYDGYRFNIFAPDMIKSFLVINGILGLGHAVMSFVTVAKVVQIRKTFDRLSSGRIYV